jgi:TPR repeat protein
MIFIRYFTLVFFSVTISYANANDDLKKGLDYLSKQDKSKAFYYLEKASKDNNAEASYNLALMYYMGDGVDQNVSMSAKLLESASNQGYEDAINNVGKIYMQLLKFDKAIKWLTINAEHGDIQANYLLAEIYIQKEDFKNAKINAKIAIDHGILEAKDLWNDYNLSKY